MNACRMLPVRELEDLAEAFSLLEAGTSVLLGTRSGEGDPTVAGDGVRLGLRTSGTTGAPTVVWHAWDELRGSAVPGAAWEGWSWASPYRPDTFAGVQVALQAWRAGGRCLSLDVAWTEVWARLAKERPQALCCTPTFLDLLLMAEGSGWSRTDWTPRQITLGGEPLRMRIGQAARSRFPDARITVVYASSELGRIARTHRHDGWFEAGGLDERWTEFRVVDRVLELRGPEGWRSTGDLAELEGDRFRVLGRAGAVANVGGTKISLPEIEELAEDLPGVQAATAWAAPSAVTGHIVAIKFSVLPGADAASVHEMLERHLRQHLPKEAWPRRWELVPAGCGPNAKKRLGP